jgi:hypothetical protein
MKLANPTLGCCAIIISIFQCTHFILCIHVMLQTTAPLLLELWYNMTMQLIHGKVMNVFGKDDIRPTHGCYVIVVLVLQCTRVGR